jgi:uncharacterized membrane-anchored protein
MGRRLRVGAKSNAFARRVPWISFWVFSMPAVAGVPAEQLVGAAQFPVEKMQPAIRAFWMTYVETRGLNSEEARDALERSVSYGAARMIHTAYEYMYPRAADHDERALPAPTQP